MTAGLSARDPDPDPLARLQAPVEVRLEVDTRADPARVWQILTRFEAWPLWHRGVHFAALDGELVQGARLHWRADGMRIHSRLVEVEPERVLGMATRTLGGRGYHRWSLEPMEGTGTLIRSEEIWDGLVVRILKGTLRRTLKRSRRHWLEALRERAEGADHST